MGRVGISIIHACILKVKSNTHQSNIIKLHYTGNKFLQSGLEGNKYNNKKSLNHATLNHVVHYVTLQNTEQTIYQETFQLAQINIKFFQECTYNTDKYWPHLIDFLQGQEIINLGPVAPGAQLGIQRVQHQKSCLSQLRKQMLHFCNDLIHLFQSLIFIDVTLRISSLCKSLKATHIKFQSQTQI